MADRQEEKKEYKRQKSPRRGGPGGGGPGAILAPGEKPKNFRKAVLDTLKYMGSYKLALVFVVIITGIATIFETLGPKVMGQATTIIANEIGRAHV